MKMLILSLVLFFVVFFCPLKLISKIRIATAQAITHYMR